MLRCFDTSVKSDILTGKILHAKYSVSNGEVVLNAGEPSRKCLGRKKIGLVQGALYYLKLVNCLALGDEVFLFTFQFV